MQTAEWLNRELYPFEPHHLELEHGRMHYVDEGSGAPVVLVHGTPTWSFLYRNLIRRLSRGHRVVAPDHLGFGLSDKPESGPYRPEDHARRLRLLIEALDLKDITLVVHDFGGPIGLSYAIEQPDNVARVVLFNTWMWSLRGNTGAERASRFFGGAIGRFLYTGLNFSPRVLLRAAYADKRKLTPEVHRHYTSPFSRPDQRLAPWQLARELIGSSDWFDHLWRQRARLADKPALILWGSKDPFFGESELRRWEEALPTAAVVRVPDAGHFVMEEAPETVEPLIDEFVTGEGALAQPVQGR